MPDNMPVGCPSRMAHRVAAVIPTTTPGLPNVADRTLPVAETDVQVRESDLHAREQEIKNRETMLNQQQAGLASSQHSLDQRRQLHQFTRRRSIGHVAFCCQVLARHWCCVSRPFHATRAA